MKSPDQIQFSPKNKNEALASDIESRFEEFAKTLRIIEGRRIDLELNAYVSNRRDGIHVAFSGESTEEIIENFKKALRDNLNSIPEGDYPLKGLNLEWKYMIDDEEQPGAGSAALLSS
ncbi:MAG: hypothetical protein V4665_01800 [Patescibacteria group bacterium]